jgi:hypothetical protein
MDQKTLGVPFFSIVVPGGSSGVGARPGAALKPAS